MRLAKEPPAIVMGENRVLGIVVWITTIGKLRGSARDINEPTSARQNAPARAPSVRALVPDRRGGEGDKVLSTLPRHRAYRHRAMGTQV
jgi:hypothetical protein